MSSFLRSSSFLRLSLFLRLSSFLRSSSFLRLSLFLRLSSFLYCYCYCYCNNPSCRCESSNYWLGHLHNKLTGTDRRTGRRADKTTYLVRLTLWLKITKIWLKLHPSLFSFFWIVIVKLCICHFIIQIKEAVLLTNSKTLPTIYDILDNQVRSI